MKRISIIILSIAMLFGCSKYTPAPSATLHPIAVAFPQIDTATLWYMAGTIKIGAYARISSTGQITISDYSPWKGGTFIIDITDSIAGTTQKTFNLVLPGHSKTIFTKNNTLAIAMAPNGREYYRMNITPTMQTDSFLHGVFIDSL